MALRALQLKAYAAAIDALRVSDPLSPNALQLVESLKKTFKISEVSYFLFLTILFNFSSHVTAPKFAERAPTDNCAKSRSKSVDMTPPRRGYAASAALSRPQPSRLAWRQSRSANSPTILSKVWKRTAQSLNRCILLLNKRILLKMMLLSRVQTRLKLFSSEAISNRKLSKI